MKKLFYILLILAITFASACKKDKKKSESLNQDTISLTQYEEFYGDESDTTPVINNDEQTNSDDTSITSTANADTEVEEIQVEDTTGKLTPATEEVIQQPTANFYIIVGSYTKLSNAQKRADYFKQLGYTAEVLPKFGKYNRVSIANFNNEASARAELKNLRKKFNDRTYWLLIRL